MSDHIVAPWTEDQVAALNAFQRSGLFHPFTCGNEEHRLRPTLVAEPDGWVCTFPECSYTQVWAHAFMASRETLEAMQRLWIWQPPQHSDATALSAELKRRNGLLHQTEDQLAEARARIGTLEQQNRAMRIVLSRVTQAQKAGASPSVEQTAGECDASWVLSVGGRNIEDNHLPAALERGEDL